MILCFFYLFTMRIIHTLMSHMYNTLMSHMYCESVDIYSQNMIYLIHKQKHSIILQKPICKVTLLLDYLTLFKHKTSHMFIFHINVHPTPLHLSLQRQPNLLPNQINSKCHLQNQSFFFPLILITHASFIIFFFFINIYQKKYL